ncbi:MAG: DUF1049 domain-containing protein [Candidatus Aminicenantes bacterium]|nr:DUF1049 domain-containing protein [Candidatus Aminicenantes bacterium]
MKPKTIIILILVVLTVIVILQNTEMVALQVLFWKIIMSQIIFISFLLLVGFIMGFLVATLVRR